jgi:chloramphenicol 3-O phosphotransferase
MTGRVIVLNGASSAGKTTLGRALQDRLEGTWLLLGIDTFVGMLPWKLYGTTDGHTINPDGTIDISASLATEQGRWRVAVAALVRAGSDVILDEVFLRGAEEQAEWRAVLAGLDVTWVGVRCEPTVAAAREQARGDRSLGMARVQSATVHVGVEYALEIDTTDTAAEDCAAAIAHSQIG